MLKKLNILMKIRSILFSNIVFCVFICVIFWFVEFSNYFVDIWFVLISLQIIILFYEALQFKTTNVLCYNCQTLVRITDHVFSPLILNVFKVIVDIFFLVVSVSVFNQSHGHWLLFDALHVAITMALKLKTKLEWYPLWLIWWKMI
jgi:hypothetical protein